MKKLIAMILALIMCLSLCACGSEVEETVPTTEPEPVPTEYVPMEIELCAEYTIGELKSVLKKPESLTVNDLFGVETEDSYIIAVNYSAQNSFGDTITDNLFLEVMVTENGFAVRTYGSGDFMGADNQKYTAQFCAKNKKRSGYSIFDAQTMRVVAFVESEVTAEIVEFQGKLKGKNDSYEGAWNVKIGDDDFLKLVYFAEGVDLSWYENFTGNPYEVTISALLEEGRYYDAVIVSDPILDADDEERFQRFNWYDREFYKAYVQEMTPLSEEDVRTALSGKTFKMRNKYGGDEDGTHTITFFENGSLDAGYTYDGEHYTMYEKWRIEGGNVIVVNPQGSEAVLTPYQFDETRYLLIELGKFGDSAMILTVSE